MRMYDLIEKKRDGQELSEAEIRWLISGYVAGDIPDYQMSAMLMAIYFRGMNDRETAILKVVADIDTIICHPLTLPGINPKANSP